MDLQPQVFHKATWLEPRTFSAHACGKIIVCGEHAVVYGKHAIAVPIPLAVVCEVSARDDRQCLVGIPAWGIPMGLQLTDAPTPVQAAIQLIRERLGVHKRGFAALLHAQVPRGSGLGGSAAMAVAAVRAFAGAFSVDMGASEVNDIAFACEQIAHGNPSGVDNTLSTYAQALLFRKSPRVLQPLRIAGSMHLVIGQSGTSGLTAQMVQHVAKVRLQREQWVDAILDDIDATVLAAKDALQMGDFAALGKLMDHNHVQLCRLGVSSRQLDALVKIAKGAGALGAKLTGGGGGGAMVALCEDDGAHVLAAMQAAGFAGQSVRIAPALH